MATTDAIVNLKVVGIATLTQLENAFSRLQKRVGGVQGAIAGLGLAAFTRNAFQAADAMVDLSNATGITITQIIELQYAIEEAGGRLDQVNSSVLKFSLSIDEARQGSIKLQDAFAELGVSLEDLGRMSEEQLLQEVAKGFLEIKNQGRQAALANEIFGKSIRGTEIQKFAQQILDNKGKFTDYGDAVNKAAELQGKLDKSLIDLRIAFLTVIEPLVTWISELQKSEDGLQKIITLVQVLTVLLGVLAGGALLRGLVGLFGTIAKAFTAFGRWRSATQAAKAVDTFTDSANKASKASKDWANNNSRLMTMLRGFGVLGGGVAGGVGAAALVGAGEEDYQGGGGQFGGRGATGSWGPTPEQQQQEIAVINQRTKALQQIRDIGIEYARQQEEIVKGIRRQREALDLSEQEVAVRDAYNEAIQRANDEIRKLETAKSQLGEDEKYQASVYQEQIDLINKRKEADAQAAASETRSLQNRLVLNEELIKDIELINNMLANEQTLSALQRQGELIGLTGDALAEKQILLQTQEDLESRLLEIQQKRNQLAAEAEKLGPARVSAEIERLNEEERLAREYADKKLQIEKDLNEKTKALRNDTTLATKTFFEQLERSIDPAVLTAQKWESVFANIENAIDELVTTGKFNFKDFALSIIADLLKIQMRAIIVQAILSAIGAIFGGGPTAATGSSISPIPGARFAAKGANALSGQPFIVGEQGPELFVPKTAGAIVPNDKLGGQVSAPITNNYNTYNINAVDAKSVAQLFAENRKSLLGAVGMAQKEMPYMMGG